MKKFNKVLAVIFSAMLMLTALTVSAFAYGFDDAENVDVGDTVKGEMSDYGTTYYRVDVNEKGTLTVDFTTQIRATDWSLFDEDGTYVNVSALKMKAGTSNGVAGSETFRVVENQTSQKATGTISYKVNKGSYYLALHNDNPYGGKTYKVSFSFKKDNAKEFSYLGITMKKGSTMQLEAVDADKDDTAWSSSKKAIVTVSSTGKLTAKKKGTAIITCESGDVTVKLKVVVK